MKGSSLSGCIRYTPSIGSPGVANRAAALFHRFPGQVCPRNLRLIIQEPGPESLPGGGAPYSYGDGGERMSRTLDLGRPPRRGRRRAVAAAVILLAAGLWWGGRRVPTPLGAAAAALPRRLESALAERLAPGFEARLQALEAECFALRTAAARADLLQTENDALRALTGSET